MYDIEIVVGMRPIFINTLVDMYGTVLSASHTLGEALAAFRCDTDAMHAIHLRQYFTTLHEAEKYVKASTYLSDGVVAISVNNHVTWKLKTVRAIELRMCGSGRLLTEDSFNAATIPSSHNLEMGSIVEVRFKQQSNRLRVTSVFPQPDKVKANDRLACVAVISCMSTTFHSDTSVCMAVVS